MGTIIRFSDKLNTQIQLDSVQSINPSQQATITEFPVEEGSNISDNIDIQPEKLSISGIITSVKQNKNHTPDVIGFANTLEKNYKDKTFVTVVTPRKIYRNFAIESYNLPLQTGRYLDIPLTINFKEINTAVTKSTRIPASEFKTKSDVRRNLKGTKKGQASKQEITATSPAKVERKSSYLAQLFGAGS